VTAGPMVELDVRELRLVGALLLTCAAARAAVDTNAGIPCLLRETTGIPCPLCGMTTSVTETVRLDLREAATASPGGVVLVALVLALLVRPPNRLRFPAALIYSALAALWLFQLQRFSLL
jgi:Protein of unknown function (DUF2752)